MSDSSDVTRRQTLLMAGAGAAAGMTGTPVLAADAPTQDRAALARDAYIWGFPLVQYRLYTQLAHRNGLPFNQLVASSEPSTPATPASPTVDVVYGLGWLDLAAEPVVLCVPDTHDRYYAVQMLDAYFNTIGYVGRRTTGTKAGSFAIIGPNWQGALPAGVKPITSPTNHMMLMTRTRIIAPEDFHNALAVQAAFATTPLSKYPAIANPNRFVKDALNTYYPIVYPAKLGVHFFDELSLALADDPPPAAEHAFVESLAQIGVGPGKTPSATNDADLLKILSDTVPATDAFIRARPINAKNAVVVNGWSVNYTITGFLEDPLDRASMDSLTPGAQVNKELLYFSVFNLEGGKNYVLHFPPDQLPKVDAFWSLTVSGTDWYLIANPIDRYAINDRTPGLKWGADGSLTVYIQKDEPASGPSNWLPISTKPFSCFLRMYQAKAETLDQTYIPPALRQVG